MLIKIIRQASIVSLIAVICLGGLGISGSRSIVYAEKVDSFMDNFNDPQKIGTLGYLASWPQGKIQWKTDHAEVVDGKFVLTFDDSGSEGTTYASAQFTTFENYGYGRYSASIKAAKDEGLITNFYVYSANEDWTLENIVEARVLGGSPSKLNIRWTKDNIKQEKFITLNFDASAKYNDYEFEWSEDAIKWYVNDELVTTATDGIPSNPGGLIVNLMADDVVNYTGPNQASFDYIKYHKFGEDDPENDIDQGPPIGVEPPVPTSPAYSFTDGFDSFNNELWYKSDGWGNGPDFNVGWQADHVEFSDGKMVLRLDDTPSSGKPYSSGEYATTALHGYGRIESRLKVAKGDGLVTSIFTYSPNADEIDIEILGKDPTKMETNYYVKGVRGLKAHAIIDLGFDASADFHDYAIEWSWNYIRWYVDGELVRNVESNKGDLPSESSTIMTNLWAGAGAAADTWTNKFDYPGTPIRAYYDSIKFTPEISFSKPSYELRVGETISTTVHSLVPGGAVTDVTREASYRFVGEDNGVLRLTDDGNLVGLKEGTSVIQATYQNTTALANIVIKNVFSGGGGVNSGSEVSTSVTTPVNDILAKLMLKAGIADQISIGDDIKIGIPVGATDQDLEITIKKMTDTNNLDGKQKDLLSSVYNVTLNKINHFLAPLVLTIKFDEKKLSGQQQPSIFYYDEMKEDWVELGGKIKGDLITVEVEQLTKFAVFAVEKVVETPTSSQFIDIANHWAKADLLSALEAGFISGYSDHTFRPDNTITRSEFTIMLVKALQIKNEDDSMVAFTDETKIGDWAKQAISQAASAKITLGYEDGSFRPDSPITRNEMVTMIARALQLSNEAYSLTSFDDQVDIPSWARPYFAAAIEHGILEGRPNNELGPFGTATRAEAVIMLLRAGK
ncbi:beta-glucanase (GH16 family) [Paenibacillus anaericanus]|uniref:family 16 glycosylhydrolase n=1 Tax=Paenibacillus anaericanus TaxID=170367 RepID=UPI0027848263|nr:family 16 glycosylhydrolase [Paenibacillus anaericanus]MDQ0087853.1 beta-glucanase (GH16 family) [Paenibacillus anaericanus]